MKAGMDCGRDMCPEVSTPAFYDFRKFSLFRSLGGWTFGIGLPDLHLSRVFN